MNRRQIRQYKSHFGVRWTELRHKQKTGQLRLCLENKFVLSEITAQPVLALDCLGEVYQGIVDLDTKIKRTYETLLLINNINFKYQTVEGISRIICQHKSLANRIIVNFHSMFVLYDRLCHTPNDLLSQLVNSLSEDFVVKRQLLLMSMPNYGFGNVFLSLDRIAH